MPTTVAGEPEESSQAVPPDAGQNNTSGIATNSGKSDVACGPNCLFEGLFLVLSSIARTPRKVEAEKAKAEKLTGKRGHNNTNLFFGVAASGGPGIGAPHLSCARAAIAVSPQQAAQTDDLAAQALATVRQSAGECRQV